MTIKTQTQASPLAQGIFLGCFIVSGAAGLVFEVVCGTLLSQLMGASHSTHAVVLAFFMGGLAAGNWLGGRRADRTDTPWLTYATLEVIVGLLVIIAVPLVGLLGKIYVHLAPEPQSSITVADYLLRIGLTGIAVMPASVAMGATLPVLVRALTRRMSTLGNRIGWLYFANSIGAAVGAALAGFVLVPTFGLHLTLVLAGMANLLVAGTAYVVGRMGAKEALPSRPNTVGPETTQDAPRTYSAAQVRAAKWAVFLSGFAAMAFELGWTRVLGVTMGGSAHVFSLMLATFVGGIAFGGLFAAWLTRNDRDAFGPLLWAESIAVLAIMVAVPFYDLLPLAFHAVVGDTARTQEAYPFFLLKTAGVSGAVMAIPAIALGATLPLASRVVAQSLSQAGTGVGSVFAINTIGNVLGATLVGSLVVSMVGPQGVFLIGAAFVVAAVFVLARVGRKWPVFMVVLLAWTASTLVPKWDPLLMQSGMYRFLRMTVNSVEEYRRILGDVRIVFSEEDREASVMVLENEKGDRVMRVNGKSDASTSGDVPTQVLAAQIPLLLSKGTSRVLIVGLGSGMTVASALTHSSVKRVDVVEISSAVVGASKHFSKWTRDPLRDPRVHLYVRDARNFLRTLPEDVKYDAIISEPSNPWQPGSAALFTSEYLAQVRSRLAARGVFCQWFPAYELNQDGLDTILYTFARQFRNTRLFNTVALDMLLVAGHGQWTVDLDDLGKRLKDPAIANDLKRINRLDTPLGLMQLLQHEVAGPKKFRSRWGFEGFGMVAHTDRFPRIQYQAAQSFYARHRTEYLDYIDERLEARRGNGTLLARFLGDRQLSDADLRAVIQYQKQWKRGTGIRLVQGLRRNLQEQGVSALPPLGSEEDCVRAAAFEKERVVAASTVFRNADSRVGISILRACTDKTADRALDRLKRALLENGVPVSTIRGLK